MSSKHKSSDGDWTCSDVKCNNLNFARRSSCNRCGKEREPSIDSKKNKQSIEIGKAAAEKSHGLFSADDWQCSKCGNVNWARRNTCNMCNAPKVGEVEERTGYGGGFNEREGVEYIRREESDDEFDEFGLRKKKFRGALPPAKSIVEQPTRVADNDEKKEEEDDDDDEDDEADLSKYDLCGDEDDDDDIALDEKKEYSSKDTKATNKNNTSSQPKLADHNSRSRSMSRSYSRSHSGSSKSSRSRSYSKDGSHSSNSRSQSPKSKSGRKNRSRSHEAGRRKRSFGSNSSYSSKSRSRSRSRSYSKDKRMKS